MKAVSKLKFKLINVTGCILLLGEFLDIKLDLDFSARLEHKINMKLVNIFVPKEQAHVYAIQESEKVYLFKSNKVQKNCIRVTCRKRICKRSLKLYPTNNLRYEKFYFIHISRIIIVCNLIIAIKAQIKIYLELIFQVTSFFLRLM